MVLAAVVPAAADHPAAGDKSKNRKFDNNIILFYNLISLNNKGGQMSRLSVPYNIQSYAEALAEGLSYGDRVHIDVVGKHIEVIYEGIMFIHVSPYAIVTDVSMIAEHSLASYKVQ